MREHDGRKLDHTTLEQLRIRAVRQVEHGAQRCTGCNGSRILSAASPATPACITSRLKSPATYVRLDTMAALVEAGLPCIGRTWRPCICGTDDVCRMVMMGAPRTEDVTECRPSLMSLARSGASGVNQREVVREGFE
jgi:hypothetical protein